MILRWNDNSLRKAGSPEPVFNTLNEVDLLDLECQRFRVPKITYGIHLEVRWDP